MGGAGAGRVGAYADGRNDCGFALAGRGGMCVDIAVVLSCCCCVVDGNGCDVDLTNWSGRDGKGGGGPCETNECRVMV